jgi:hypothetical protein
MTTTTRLSKPSLRLGKHAVRGDEVQYWIDGRLTPYTMLGGVARSTGYRGTRRMSAPQLRRWLAGQGIVDPDHSVWWVDLPNGVHLSTTAVTNVQLARIVARRLVAA